MFSPVLDDIDMSVLGTPLYDYLLDRLRPVAVHVLDPFCGSDGGAVLAAILSKGYRAVGYEISVYKRAKLLTKFGTDARIHHGSAATCAEYDCGPKYGMLLSKPPIGVRHNGVGLGNSSLFSYRMYVKELSRILRACGRRMEAGAPVVLVANRTTEAGTIPEDTEAAISGAGYLVCGHYRVMRKKSLLYVVVGKKEEERCQG